MVGVYLRRIWTGGACGIQNNGWKSITKNLLLPGSLTSYLPGRESPRRCVIGAGDLLIPNSPGGERALRCCSCSNLTSVNPKGSRTKSFLACGSGGQKPGSA